MTIKDIIRKVAEAAGGKDPAATAVACRSAVRDGVGAIYQSRGAEIPPKASLLELLSDTQLREFIGDDDRLRDLEFVRVLGMNAEHSRKVKRTHAQLAAGISTSFLETVAAKLDGRSAPPRSGGITEAETRRAYIDVYLEEAGWDVLETEGAMLPGKAGVEIKVEGMPNGTGEGFCDYVLYGRDLRPLAVVEAKKTSVGPEKGRQQVKLYGECLERKYGYTPILYYTNGYQIWCIDGFYPSRQVRAFHTLEELERLIQRRDRKSLRDTDLQINRDIAGRDYQITAVTKICEKLSDRKRAGLLVMSTGTGKTRTVISLVDVLARQNWITNVLFLADRTSLVSQAHDAFMELLPDYPRSVISDSALKGSPNARISFSTYQTMINKIDGAEKEFTAGRFDLVVVDEAHRSIFNKYGAIFKYFDALLVGLTATPRGEVDKNTYSLFQCESDVPDFDYSMEQGFKDGVLKPFRVVARTTCVLSRGITYRECSDEERRQLDEAFNDEPPDRIEASRIFNTVFNKGTVDKVIDDVMERSLKVDGGETIGKTIIFAYNHEHAKQIVDRINKKYPHNDDWCQLVDNYVNYADSLVKKFKNDPKFRIAVSVDMLDTGIDVPEVLNLVFFKPVRSRIKFIQMIGRGTRPCKNMFAPGKDKTEFRIFDYCDNFRYFGEHKEDVEASKTLSVSQQAFAARVGILVELQKAQNRIYQFNKDYHGELQKELLAKVLELKDETHFCRIQVREMLPHIDRYRTPESWQCVSEVQMAEINRYIAPLVDGGEGEDIRTKMYDLRMLRIELAVLMNGGLTDKVENDVKAVVAMSQILMTKYSIPEVEERHEDIEAIANPIFWKMPSVEAVEKWRRKLRGIMKYARGDGEEAVFVNIGDEIKPGEPVDIGIEFRTYRQKVIDFLRENWSLPVVEKIHKLEPLTADDMEELEDILWRKLGSKTDYDGEDYAGSLAGFVRSLVGLDQAAVNEKFGQYLTGTVFNSNQQEFVKMVINYVRENGEITCKDLANSYPFRLLNAVQLFGEKMPILLDVITRLEKLLPTAA